MAGTSVQGISDTLAYIQTEVPPAAVKSTKTAKTANGQSFDDVMTAGILGTAMTNFSVSGSTASVQTQELLSKISVTSRTLTQDTASRTQTLRTDTQSLNGIKDKVIESDLEDAAYQAGRDMVKKVSEVLDVSEEEVTTAMERAGLSSIDLLNGENVTQLTMEVTGTQDAGELLTNEELFADLQELLDAANELNNALLEQFDLSALQLSTAIENLSAGLHTDIVQTVMTAPELMVTDNPLYARVEAADTAPRVEVEVDEEGGMVMQEEEMMTGQNDTAGLRTNTDTQTESDTEQRRSGTGSERVNFDNAFEEVAGRLTESVNEVFNDQLGEAVQTAPLPQAEDILRQITEYIRVEAKPDVTTMELQLHPQSLGNVTIQVSQASDGNLMARFLTQNEDVRSALESQMAQLIQRFDEQGLKVTEIQVTVESHAFEQNLQQGAGDPSRQESAPEAPAARVRRIRLDGDDFTLEGAEEMSEAELLAADMMARSGNTVDYTA